MNIKLKNILNEAKGYYIKVSPRDAKKALSILDKMYRRKFDISGSDTYYFKDGSGWKYKGNWRNTAGWTSVEIAGKIIENIGPILATKY